MAGEGKGESAIASLPIPADGFHRLAAARALGLTAIVAEVRPGTRREAVLFSCGVKAQHGLRRSNADKRRAVLTLLQDEEWSQWTNVALAKACGVAESFVGKLRKESHLAQCEVRIYTTKHGTLTTMNTANIGKTVPTLNAPFTSTEQELTQQAHRLELSYSRVKDQVLPDVERNYHNPSDIDDRPGATPPLPSPVNPNSLLAAFLANLDCLSEAELETIGQALAAGETRKAKRS